MKPILLFSIVAILSSTAFAAKVEKEQVVGPVYEILEPDLIAQLKAKLEDDQKSGAYQAAIKRGQERATKSVLSPPPNTRLRTTVNPRSREYDPTITVERDTVSPADGKVLIQAGTRLNPLDRQPWPEPWIFIDGRDEAQVRHADKLVKATKGNAKVILTGGSYQDVSKALNHIVFYDQQGYLVSRFGIEQVPATITQSGRVLRIDEVKP